MLTGNSIGILPTSIKIKGREYAIRHDFRPCLDIILMFEDVDLTDLEKVQGMIEILFEEEPPMCEETILEAVKFLDMETDSSSGNSTGSNDRLFSWAQDSNYIFSAVDKVLGFSSRRCQYLHWWEFMGAFMEIGECTFSTIIYMRKQKKKGKLTKEEKEYWAENRKMFELQKFYTEEEQAQIDRFLALAKGGGS